MKTKVLVDPKLVEITGSVGRGACLYLLLKMAHKQHAKDEWFITSLQILTEKLGLKDKYVTRRFVDALRKQDLIETRRKGFPARFEARIQQSKLATLLGEHIV